MPNTTSARECGNCGARVDAAAVTCPACDVLLAAYQSPDGATFGTDIATHPVDMAETPEPAPSIDVPDAPAPPVTAPSLPPTRSPISDTLSTLQAEGPTRPSYSLPRQSPIAKAMEETKAAVDATPQPTSEAERQAIASIMASADEIVQDRQEALNVPEEYREDPDFEDLGLVSEDTDDHDEPDPPAQPETSAPQPKPAPRRPGNLPKSESSVVNKVRAQAEAGWFDENREQPASTTPRQPRPSPAERAASRRPPFQLNALPEDSPNALPNMAKIGAYIVGGLILLSILGRTTSGMGLIVPLIVIVLIWYMASMSKKTGRKTTSIPRDRRPR